VTEKRAMIIEAAQRSTRAKQKALNCPNRDVILSEPAVEHQRA